jgi:hypothetical protein
MEKGGWFVRVASRIRGCFLSQAFSSGVRVTTGFGAERCALTRSAFKPEIKKETARKAMVSDLCRVLIILVPPRMVTIKTIRKKTIINEVKINKLMFGEIFILIFVHYDYIQYL